MSIKYISFYLSHFLFSICSIILFDFRI